MKVQTNKQTAQKRKFRLSDLDLYIMLAPLIIMMLLFSYKPLTGLVIAFKDYSPFLGMWKSKWVGMEHFIEFFNSPFFSRTIFNTLIISGCNLLFGFPAPIILALMLNEVRHPKYKKTVQTISYIPHFISTVIVCSIVTNFLSPTTGIVNFIITNSFGGDSVHFLSQPKYFVPIYTMTNIWKTVGYGSIVYLASLASISGDLYEAAKIDGASRFQQLIHVTLPGLTPTIVVMLLIQLGKILNVGYEMIILLYQPSTYEAADVITTYAYRVGIAEGRYDYATAIGLFNSLIAFVLVIGANKFSRKLTETSLW